jgi:hypothetical protein
MPWTRGDGDTDYELSRAQSWIEFWDPRLDGGNGKGIGMYQEWQDFKSQRKAFESFLRFAIWAIGVVAAVPGVLVALSALGIVHLR